MTELEKRHHEAAVIQAAKIRNPRAAARYLRVARREVRAIQAIKVFCEQCQGWRGSLPISQCGQYNCALWMYRPWGHKI